MTFHSEDGEGFDLLSRPIMSVSADDFPMCPDCGLRMGTVAVNVSGIWMPASVAADDGGPIFEARCADHGAWPFQVEDLTYDA